MYTIRRHLLWHVRIYLFTYHSYKKITYLLTNLLILIQHYLVGSQSQGPSGTIYVNYLANNEVELATRLPAGSLLKLRLPKTNASKAINYTFHLGSQLARFVISVKHILRFLIIVTFSTLFIPPTSFKI